MWFLRFSLDFRCSTLACGNRLANVFVFDPHAATSGPKAKLKIPHGKSCVRQTAVSYDGRTIFACCDDGTICRWDHVAGAAGSAEEEDALHNLRDAGFDDYVRRADDSGGRSSSSEDEEEEEGEEGGGVRRRRRGGSGPAGVHMQRNKGMR